MKTSNHLTIIVFAFLALAVSAFAQEPNLREQFNAAVAAFQKSATEDHARKLAELAKQLQPLPAVPEEAEFRALKGAAFVKQAGDSAAFAKAATEFRAAITTAPWVGEYHYNLAVCEKAAGQFDAARTAVKFAQLLARDDKERHDCLALRAELEAAQELAVAKKTEEQKAAHTAQKEAERKRPTVVGKWDSGVVRFEVIRTGQQYTVTSVVVLGQKGYATNVSVDEQHVRFTAVYSNKSSQDLTLSESGNELLGRSGSNEGAKFTRNP